MQIQILLRQKGYMNCMDVILVIYIWAFLKYML